MAFAKNARRNEMKRMSFFTVWIPAFTVMTIALSGLFFSAPLRAQEDGLGAPIQFPSDEYFRAEVIRALEKGDEQAETMSVIVQQVRLRIVSGREKGLEVTAQNALLSNKSEGLLLKEGDAVVGVKSYNIDGVAYAVTDRFRLFSLVGIFIFFFALVAFFGRMRGVLSLGGLLVSIVIIAAFIVPQILAGRDPLAVSIVGSFAILGISLYLAHGFSKQTSVALASTAVTLVCAAVVAVVFVKLGQFFGSGSEEALYLQFGNAQDINLRGLLLGGIIIGTLGVLDDITTVQTATIKELKEANSAYSFAELFRRGMSVGREHIASLVNTLALAYTGASLPIL
ncbi:MAG: YibE/F family protein, partial [Patescibacteria group bacterium]